MPGTRSRGGFYLYGASCTGILVGWNHLCFYFLKIFWVLSRPSKKQWSSSFLWQIWAAHCRSKMLWLHKGPCVGACVLSGIIMCLLFKSSSQPFPPALQGLSSGRASAPWSHAACHHCPRFWHVHVCELAATLTTRGIMGESFKKYRDPAQDFDVMAERHRLDSDI